MPTVPVPNNYFETLLPGIQLYSKYTNINTSSSRLTPTIFIKTAPCNSTVETSPLILVVLMPRYMFLQSKTLRVYSLFVILLCLPFQKPNSTIVMLDQFIFGYSFNSLIIKLKSISPKVLVASSHNLCSKFSDYFSESNLTPGCSTTLLLSSTVSPVLHLVEAPPSHTKDVRYS